VSTQLMRDSQVPIDDLHKIVWEHIDDYLAEDQLHLSEAGQQACARAAVEAIEKNGLEG